MNDDGLRKLLREADAAAGQPPKVAGDLARRVRVLAARRRRVEFGMSAAAAILLATGMTFLMSQSTASRSSAGRPAIVKGGPAVAKGSPIVPESADIVAEIARLDREASVRLAVARRTEELVREMRERDAAKRTQEVYVDPVADARREVEKAAYTLVSQADRMCRDMNLCAAAEVNYRRVLELFPETPWATVARQRLDEIKSKGGIS